MEHLQGDRVGMTKEEARELATNIGLSKYLLDEQGLERLNKIAQIISLNPEVVNTKLPKEI